MMKEPFIEYWQEIHAGLEVSNRGRLRSYYKKGFHGRQPDPLPRKASINKAGVPWIGFGGTSSMIKTLVAECFLGYDGKGKIVNIDGNKLNCRMDNLEIRTDIHRSSNKIPKKTA